MSAVTLHAVPPTLADEIMAQLHAAHEGLSEPESAALNVRLVLALAAQLATAQGLSAVSACLNAAQNS